MSIQVRMCTHMRLNSGAGFKDTSLRENSPSLGRPHNHTSHESLRLSSSLNVWKNKTVSLHPDVNIVPSTLPETFVLPYQDCVPLPRSPKAGVVVCVHPVEEDIWVSGALKSGKLWEEPLIVQFGDYLQRFPEIVFVDIGSNIEEYALYAAAIGRQVLAVEMLPMNVQHIQKAVRISDLGPEVTIVNNALYVDHRVLTAKIPEQNVGGTELENSEIATVNDSKADVHTICMDDLIPLLEGALAFVKMDIENSEHQALRGARSFFLKVNVQVVQMEWLPTRTKAEVSEILQFMNSSGYMLSTSPNQYTAPDINNLIGDFFFLKMAKV